MLYGLSVWPVLVYSFTLRYTYVEKMLYSYFFDFIKAESLQLKPHQFICMRNFNNKKSWKSKKLTPLLLYQYYISFKSWLLGGLSFFNFQLFSNKISHANNWMRKKIPTCSNSALLAWVNVYSVFRYYFFFAFTVQSLGMTKM